MWVERIVGKRKPLFSSHTWLRNFAASALIESKDRLINKKILREWKNGWLIGHVAPLWRSFSFHASLKYASTAAGRADVSPIAADGFSNFPRITRVCKDLRATAIRITVNSKGRAGIVKNRPSVVRAFARAGILRDRGASWHDLWIYLLKNWKFSLIEVSRMERACNWFARGGFARFVDFTHAESLF